MLVAYCHSGCLRGGHTLSTGKRVQDETRYLKRLGIGEAVDASDVTQALVGLQKAREQVAISLSKEAPPANCICTPAPHVSPAGISYLLVLLVSEGNTACVHTCAHTDAMRAFVPVPSPTLLCVFIWPLGSLQILLELAPAL